MINPIIFEGIATPEFVTTEDSGAAIIIEPDWTVSNADNKIFIRIHSYDDSIFSHYLYEKNDKIQNSELGHKSANSLKGKKIKVTVEIID